MENKLQSKLFEVRDLRNGEWYWIQKEIYEEYAPKIGVIGLALYNAYASYARNEGECYPSLKTISEKLKISIPTIIKYNKILEQNNLIKIESGKKEGTSNIVYLLKLKGINQFNRGIKQINTPSKTGLDLGIKQVNTELKAIELKTINNNISIRDSKTSPYGNEDINYLMMKFQEITGLRKMDGSIKQNRRYCWLLLKKVGGKKENVEKLIKIAVRDSFHRANLTSFKYLYYNAVKILNQLKVEQENPRVVEIKLKKQ